MKNKIWKGLNSPVVVALLTVLLLTFMFKVWTADLFSSFDTEDQWERRIEALGRQEVMSFKEVAFNEKSERRFVGEVHNHSDYVVENLQGTVCLYNSEGEIVDVMSGELEGLEPLLPGQSSKFFLSEWSSSSDSYSEPSLSPKGDFRSTLVIVDLSAKKLPEKIATENTTSSYDNDPFKTSSR
ncbi:hypothetical protein P3T73_15200 [Kiritimatiellota bacterium B12222]|nr:hypothetical protein P3T73_15200 [Kiritimatiellota bacterium B12222]